MKTHRFVTYEGENSSSIFTSIMIHFDIDPQQWGKSTDQKIHRIQEWEIYVQI